MVGIPRQGLYGFPVKLPKSAYTQERVIPTKGYTDLPDISAGPSSIVSGQNVWIWQERLTPRPRLLAVDGNALNDVPTGAFTYFDVNGIAYPVIASQGTFAYLSSGSWTALTYNSGVSNEPPSGGAANTVHGTSIYLPRADANIAVWVNGVNPAFCWAGEQNGTQYSTLSQGLIAEDVTIANSRLIYWNVGYLSSTSQLVTRVAWTAAGDPEDTTGIDSGYNDLLDMRGVGTRCFTVADQLLVASDQEIWRGTFVGYPYVYQFTPLSRAQGIPYGRAAINTPEGLFWLGSDDMVYNIPPYYWYSKIDPVGYAVQRTLHRDLADPTTAFFGYHGDAKQLTLYYTDTAGSYPQRALTYNTISKVWAPQTFTHNLVASFTGNKSSTATQWDQLVGTFAQQTLSYDQLAGASTALFDGVVSSGGSAYVFRPAYEQPTDDGVAVLEEATMGPMFTAMPERRKFLDETRIDVQCDSTSSMSVAISGDLGQTFPAERLITLSAGSASSQYLLKHTGVSGVNHTIRLRSIGGAWNVNAITGRAKIEGEAI